MQHHYARLVPLHGTVKKTAAHLDFKSLAALQYAEAWAVNRGHRRAPLSLILRRALRVYAAHLEATGKAEPTAPAKAGEPLGPLTLREVRALEDAGKGGGALHPENGLLTEASAQSLTLRRLEVLSTLPPDQPWPTFADTLHGAEVVARGRAAHMELEASVSRHLEATASKVKGRLKGPRRSPTG